MSHFVGVVCFAKCCKLISQILHSFSRADNALVWVRSLLCFASAAPLVPCALFFAKPLITGRNISYLLGKLSIFSLAGDYLLASLLSLSVVTLLMDCCC